jgi:hypothetical protein
VRRTNKWVGRVLRVGLVVGLAVGTLANEGFAAWAWTASAVYGLWLGVDGIRRARFKLSALREYGLNGLRQIGADATMRRESLRLVVQILAGIVGAAALLDWNDFLRVYLGLILVFYQYAVVSNAHYDRRDDFRIEDEIEAAERRTALKASEDTRKRLMNDAIQEEKIEASEARTVVAEGRSAVAEERSAAAENRADRAEARADAAEAEGEG